MSTDASGFDQYQRIQIQGVSSADDSTPTNIHVDPTTNEVLTKLTTPDGDSVMDDTNDSVKVTIAADSAGIGGGTQYTEGDTDASITGNVVLFESNTTTSAVSTVSADNPLPVSVTGGGDATAANQSTIIGHVDGIETLLGTIDADTSSIATDSSTIAGDTTSIDAKTPALGQALASASVPVVLPATQITTLTPQTDALTDTQLRATPVPVSGSLTVDLGANNDVTVTSGTVTANLGATDNAVLDDIAANQTDASQKTQIVDGAGNVIGSTSNALDVNIASGASSGTQYTEGDTDTTITGTALMFESNTTTSALSAVSDATPLPISDAGGAITVDGTVGVSGTVTVDLGANNDVTVTGTVDLGATDNAVLDTIAAKDFATQTTLAAINAKMVTGTDIGDVTINNASGASAVNIQDGGNTITVDGTVSITANSAVNVAQMNGVATTMGNGVSGTGVQRVTIASDSTGQVKLAAGTAAIGKLTANSGVDIGDVDVTSLPSIPAGTNAIGKLTANSGVDIGDVTINNASGDAVYVRTDQNGLTSERVSNTDGASTAFSNFGATASTYNYIRAITVYNSSATDGYVDFRDGTAGSVLWTMPLPAGGGATLALDAPIFRTSANTALAYDVSGALSTVYISISGYRSTT